MSQVAVRVLLICARWIMVALVFAVPIIAFPWTVDPLEVNKQTFAIFGIILMVVSWLGAMLVEKRAHLRLLWGAVPVVLFVGGAAISTLFSSAPYLSAVGQSGQEYTSLLSIIAFAVFVISVSHLVADGHMLRRVLVASLLASAIVGGAVALPMLFGFGGANLIGTPNALGFYLVVSSVVGMGLWLMSSDDGAGALLPKGVLGAIVRSAIVFSTLTTLWVLLVLDYWVLWVATLVGTSLLFFFSFLRPQALFQPVKFVLPMLVFVFGLIFLPLPAVIPNPFPSEIAPSHGLTWEIARANLSEHGAFFGSGPGTFAFAYGQQQPIELNATSYWDTRFDRGSSHAITLFATFGLLPTLAFFAFLLSMVTFAVMYVLREKDDQALRFFVAPFLGWSVLVFGVMFYAQNFTLAFLFWVYSGVLLSCVSGPLKTYAFARSPRAGLATAFFFVLAAVGMLTMLFVTTTRYRAEIAFARGVALDRNGGEIDEVIAELDAAATANRWSDIYYRNLGHALLYKVRDVLGDSATDPEYVKALIGAAVNAAVRASDLGPGNVANWELRGDVYREVAPVVTDADKYAFEAYQRAAELAPSNPKYPVGTARTYLVQADILRRLVGGDDAEIAAQAEEQIDIALERAESSLNQALGLKPDYAQAHYYMSFVRERQGKLAEAIANMERVRAAASSDLGVSLQLALLYMRNDNDASAQRELERAIRIAPNFSNARWYLSSILAKDGKIGDAIAELETLLVLNPGNATIQARLDELKVGQNTQAPVPDPLDDGDEALPSDSLDVQE